MSSYILYQLHVWRGRIKRNDPAVAGSHLSCLFLPPPPLLPHLPFTPSHPAQAVLVRITNGLLNRYLSARGAVVAFTVGFGPLYPPLVRKFVRPRPIDWLAVAVNGTTALGYNAIKRRLRQPELVTM